MKMSNEISLVVETTNPEKSRVDFSAGIKTVNEPCAPGSMDVPYIKGACVPKEPWEEPSPSLLERIVTEPSDSNRSSSVRIMKIPDHIIQPLYNLGIQDVNTQEEVSEKCSTEEYWDSLLKIKKFASKISLDSDKLEVLGVSVKEPGLPTVTVNRKIERRIGLHLDSWDRLPLSKRDEARNRLSINIGEDDRYLLFLPLTVSSIIDYFDEQELSEHNPTQLMRRYMYMNEDNPIVKVRVGPGEAYIAPTENMIHDATTVGQSAYDFNISFLGLFKTYV